MIDDVFAVIADTTRRQILRALTNGSRPVGELVDELGISQPTVSKHLKVLRNVGLVESEAVGQKRFYSLTPEPLSQITQWIESLQGPSVSPSVTEQNVRTAVPESHESATSANLPEPPVPPAPPAPAELAEQNDQSDSSTDSDQTELASPTTGAHFALDTADINEKPAEAEKSVEDQDDAAGYFTLGEEGEVHQHVQPRIAHRALNFTPLEPFQPEVVQPENQDPTTSIDVASIPLLPAEEAETHLDVVVVEEEFEFGDDENVPETESLPVEATHKTSDSEETSETEHEPLVDSEQIAHPEELRELNIGEPPVEETDGSKDAPDLPIGYVAYTGEDESTEFIDETPAQDASEEYQMSEIADAEETFAETSVAENPPEKTETQVILEDADPGHIAEQEYSDDQQESRGFLASLTRWGRRRSR